MKRLRHLYAAAVASVAMAWAGAGHADAPQQPTDAVRQEALDNALLVLRPYQPGRADAALVTTAESLMGRTHSGFDAALYRADGKYTFVFYGYNSLKDFNEVARAGFIGVPRHQLRQADAFVEKAMETYGIKPEEMRFVGHSLGGYIAKAVAPHAGASEVWAYNSPGFKKRDTARIERLLGSAQNDPAIYNFNSEHDVVGQWGRQPGQLHEVDTPRNHHSMAQMATALGGVNIPEADKKKAGFVARVFGKVTGSKPVQKMLHNRFRRSPAP